MPAPGRITLPKVTSQRSPPPVIVSFRDLAVDHLGELGQRLRAVAGVCLRYILPRPLDRLPRHRLLSRSAAQPHLKGHVPQHPRITGTLRREQRDRDGPAVSSGILRRRRPR